MFWFVVLFGCVFDCVFAFCWFVWFDLLSARFDCVLLLLVVFLCGCRVLSVFVVFMFWFVNSVFWFGFAVCYFVLFRNVCLVVDVVCVCVWLLWVFVVLWLLRCVLIVLLTRICVYGFIVDVLFIFMVVFCLICGYVCFLFFVLFNCGLLVFGMLRVWLVVLFDLFCFVVYFVVDDGGCYAASVGVGWWQFWFVFCFNIVFVCSFSVCRLWLFVCFRMCGDLHCFVFCDLMFRIVGIGVAL